MSFRDKVLRVDDVRGVEFEGSPTILLQSHDLACTCTHDFNKVVHRQHAGSYQIGVEERESDLYSHDAVCTIGKTTTLLFGTMRRMIGGDHIDRTVVDTGEQRHLVRYIPDRRVHLPASVILHHATIKQQVMRRGLAGHLNTACLGIPNERNALFGRYMAYMQTAACLVTQTNITLHFAPFALRACA